MRKLHLQFKRATQHFAKMGRVGGGEAVTTSRRRCEFMCVHVHVSVAYSCRWLAYTLVCVNVALAVWAGVCHILEVIDQTGNQAAAEVTPYKEAEEAEECVHESDVVRYAGDDGLLTVRTHSLHRRGLEHFPLQHGHGGGCSWRSQDGCCMTPHVDKVTGTGAHLSWHRVRKVTGRRRVVCTCWWRRHWHGHGSLSRYMRGEEAWLWGLIRWRTIVWRQRLSLYRSSSYRLSILLLNKWGTGTSGVRRRRVTGHTGRMSV